MAALKLSRPLGTDGGISELVAAGDHMGLTGPRR